jgi:hypothetical protein
MGRESCGRGVPAGYPDLLADELTEQATRIADAADADGVTDEAWANATRFYGTDQLAALVTTIAVINACNRFTSCSRTRAVTTSQDSGHDDQLIIPMVDGVPAACWRMRSERCSSCRISASLIWAAK